MSQSCIFLSQSSSRDRPNDGIHSIFLVTSIMRCLNVRRSACLPLRSFCEGRSIAMYHSSATFQTNSVLQRQQPGNRCLYFSFLKIRFSPFLSLSFKFPRIIHGSFFAFFPER